PQGNDFVPLADRIAVFDNDGTLWAEQPLYVDLIFSMDRLRKMAAEDPSILTTDALRAGAKGDIKGLFAAGHGGLMEVFRVTQSCLTVPEYQGLVDDWFAIARHPDTGLPFDKMTYQPMVELLRYLRDEGFATYIVSGDDIYFIRAFSREAYGIPVQKVLGSYLGMNYRHRDGKPVLVMTAEPGYSAGGPRKAIDIDRIIGKRPIMAVGNSDGDFEMLEWTTAGEGARLGMLVHHTDAVREWAYDRDGPVGKLDRGLDAAAEMGWVVTDMASDWKTIFTGHQ
ncbi:MAG: HAD family hydrolase, partial [Pseudomonadota bacterium]